MESEIIWVILLFVILPLVEKILRKRKQDSDGQPEPEFESKSMETQAGQKPAGRTGRKSYESELERLIAEELGLDVPRSAEPEEAPSIRRPPTRKPPAHVSSPYTRLPRSTSGAPQPRSTVVYPRSSVESRPPPPKPSYESLEVPPEQSLDAQAINLDERAIAAAEQADRTRGREEAPPVARLGIGRGQERRAGPGLPDFPEWSSVKKAMVWSEILGPPKALRD